MDPARNKRRGPTLALVIRQIHAYVSVFLAPTVLFLAITGCLQVYSFHEDHGDYRAPPLIERLASLHKDQAIRKDRPQKLGAPGQDRPAKPRRDKQAGLPPSVVALKAFTFAAGLSLVLTALLGLWMAFKYTRRPRLSAALLVLGAIAPLLSFALP